MLLPASGDMLERSIVNKILHHTRVCGTRREGSISVELLLDHSRGSFPSKQAENIPPIIACAEILVVVLRCSALLEYAI